MAGVSEKEDPTERLLSGKVIGRLEQVEAALRQAIQRGRWQHRLPGVRDLADFLGTSCGTVGKALKQLESAGIIAASGPKSRYVICKRGESSSLIDTRPMTALVLIPKEVGKTPSGAHWHLVARLGDILHPKGWRVRTHAVNLEGDTVRGRSWDRLLAMENPDAVIAILGTPGLAKWALKRNLRILFCGGAADIPGVPTIAVSTGEMLERALHELMDRGHTRISFPLCERQSAFFKHVVQRFKTVLAGRGIRFVERMHTPQAGAKTPRDLRRLFLRTEATYHPTAWICLDWVEFLWLKRHLEFIGRDIPADVSLVCLSSDDAIGWIEPMPSHFEHPFEKLAKMMARWVRNPAPWSLENAYTTVTPAWIPGKTIGPFKG